MRLCQRYTLPCSSGLVIAALEVSYLHPAFTFYARRYVKDIFAMGLPFFELVTLFLKVQFLSSNMNASLMRSAAVA